MFEAASTTNDSKLFHGWGSPLYLATKSVERVAEPEIVAESDSIVEHH